VPLTGEFGDEVNVLVVARAVELAKGKGAGTLVLVIDSPGGAVADAQAIAGVLKGASGEVRIVTVIKRAISASVWVTSHSDRVFFLPGGTLGAAVAFSKDRSTGAAEVDAKMNSALAGLVASAAEARGQNGAAYRAMIVPEAALYCVATEGKTSLVAELPPAAKGTKIDGEDTVLTLTAVQAELGFAPTIPAADEASLAKALGVEKMTLAAPLKQGEQTVRAANAEIRKAKEAYDRAVEDVTKAIKEATDKAGRAAGMMKAAEEADPASVKLTYVQETGLLTAASQVKWKQ
jgi:membrane-bound ClpP family serine protease